MSLLSLLIELAQFLKKTKGGTKMCFSLREEETQVKMAENNTTVEHRVETIKNAMGNNGFHFPIPVDQETFNKAHGFCEHEYIAYGILEQGENLSPSDVMCVALDIKLDIAGTLAFSKELYFRDYYEENFPENACVYSKFSLSPYVKKNETKEKVVGLLFKKMRNFTRQYLSSGNICRRVFIETHPAVVKLFHRSQKKEFLVPQKVTLIPENIPGKSAGFYKIPGVTVYEVDPATYL